ncbi:hypothetical protein [Leptodesmis sp.]|uniref:hypothetical protein n=1 Tax=Leptodesmis sp. TaxID=3100501 RepID=UPI00405349F0
MTPDAHNSDDSDDQRRRLEREKSLEEQINSLKREDEVLYNILALDVWALAKTMDDFHPRFGLLS